MDRIKKWFAAINDMNLTLHERMFRLLSSVSLTVLVAVVAVCLLIGESVEVVVVLALSWCAVFLITMLSARAGRVDVGIQLTGVVLTFLTLPVGFFFGGGLNGGSPIWFVFCFVYICLMMAGRMRNAFLLCGVLVTGGCYLIAGLRPELVTGHADNVAYLDSFASVIMLSALICIMILFQRSAFERQNRLADEQKKEIMELNERQNHFFSSMSHEIRTPINTIIGLNEMTLREDISDEVAENSLNIQGASRILLSLINDILDMSKIESGQMTIVESPYDVGAMLSEIVNMIWSQAREKGLAFHVDIDPTLPSELNGDEVRIKQVLINILNNAVKYTEEGSITLAVQCKKKDEGRLSVSYAVSDTGSGIKKENIPYLFSAFRRVDEEKNRYIEGTGLGLSIVKQLVELMGGEVTVDSIYTKGSTFVVTLEQGIEDETAIGELHLERRRQTDRRRAYVKAFEAAKARVLVVDDNEVNLLVAKKLLRDTGMQVDAVTSGSDCLRETMHIHYDLIFMDHLMPEMDGIECLHALRAQAGGLNAETPVVALTANAGSDVMAMYEREGFDDCLLKPVNGEQLEQMALKYLPLELVSVTMENQILETESPVRKGLRKRPVRITTESVCDLPEEMLAKLSVSVLPFVVHTEGGDFLDGLEIGPNATLSYIETLGKDARASEPEVPDYIGFFARELEQAQHVVHLAAGKGTSGAYPKAMAASQTFGNVTVVNSAQMSSGLGFLVLRAAQMAEQGFGAREIVQRLEMEKSSVRTTFLLDSTKYLKKNGRIPKRANVICEAFMLHPCVAMTEQGMRMQKLYAGKRATAWRHYIARTLRDAAQIDNRLLFIAYSGLTVRDIEDIEAQVNGRLRFGKIIRQQVSPASSTMYGPGTFGLIFATRLLDEPPLPAIALRDEKMENSPTDAIIGLKKSGEYRRLSEVSQDALEEPVATGKKLPLPDGELDTALGIRNCGSEEGYREALEIYYRTIPDKTEEIERFLESGDIASYTIKVHALKSSSLIVGATELSELAKELEQAGKDGDTEKIAEKTETLLADYRHYRDLLAPLFAEDGKADGKPVPSAVLEDAYASLAEFAENMDVDMAEMVLESMKEYRLPAEDEARMREISEALLALDWEKIKRLAHQKM